MGFDISEKSKSKIPLANFEELRAGFVFQHYLQEKHEEILKQYPEHILFNDLSNDLLSERDIKRNSAILKVNSLVEHYFGFLRSKDFESAYKLWKP